MDGRAGHFKVGGLMSDHRPVYLNLLKIRLPVPGIVSFAHRITGVLLFLALPFAVYLLDLSIESQESFTRVQQMLDQPFMLLVQVLLLWAIAHHFFAGIRFLLIDAEIGVEKTSMRTGAWLVMLAEVLTVVAIVIGVCA
jgi:succinate dehydrogenase / fumarate reductase cytochrome b subunit